MECDLVFFARVICFVYIITKDTDIISAHFLQSENYSDKARPKPARKDPYNMVPALIECIVFK